MCVVLFTFHIFDPNYVIRSLPLVAYLEPTDVIRSLPLVAYLEPKGEILKVSSRVTTVKDLSGLSAIRDDRFLYCGRSR